MDPHSIAHEFNQKNGLTNQQKPANDPAPSADAPILFLDVVEKGKYDDAARMIAAGVNVNALNSQRKSALCIAVENRDRHMVKLVLKAGADVAKFEKETGASLLALLADASTNFSIEEEPIACMLMDNGANAQAYTRTGVPVLARYASLGMARAVDTALCAGAEPNATTPGEQMTALHFAVIQGNAGMITNLIARGANPEGIAQTKPSALTLALRQTPTPKKIDTIKALLTGGANPNRAQESDGMTPFLYALQTGNKEIIQVLFDGGAQVNAILPNGQSVLQNAVMNGVDDGSIDFLLKHQANPNDFSTKMGTALHAAAAVDRIGALNLLLQHQADPLRKNAEGQTPLETAIIRLGNEHPIVDRLKIADGAARQAQEQARRQTQQPPPYYGH